MTNMAHMKVYDLHGAEVMDMSSVEWDEETKQLVAKGKALGGMPMTMYIRPDELWKAKELVSWSVISHIPGMILRGRKMCKESDGRK
ncbi:MAG: hypothetical protein ACI36Y_02385 [Coriobacteriales bacterium]